MAVALKAMLDTSAVNVFVDLGGAVEALQAAVAVHAVDLMHTHVVVDELAATEDGERRARLIDCVTSISRAVPTGAAVYDISRYRQSRYTADSAAFEALRIGNAKHTKDALISATAAFADCILVARDKDLKSRAQARRIQVIGPVEFLAMVGWST